MTPPGRFGALSIESESNTVQSFLEKPTGDGASINGGFFVLDPDVLDYIHDGDQTVWERGPMETLVRDGQMAAYRHAGFWQPMDTLRDKQTLEQLWQSPSPPWKNW